MLDDPSYNLDSAIADLIWTSVGSEIPPDIVFDVQVVPGTLGSTAGAVASIHDAGHVVSPCDRVWYWNESNAIDAG